MPGRLGLGALLLLLVHVLVVLVEVLGVLDRGLWWWLMLLVVLAKLGLLLLQLFPPAPAAGMLLVLEMLVRGGLLRLDVTVVAAMGSGL